MTVRVRVELGTLGPAWYYVYAEEYDFLYAKRPVYDRPLCTLQGSYNLILHQDKSRQMVEIEALVGPTRWRIAPSLQVPKAVPGQIYVTADIDDDKSQTYFSDPNYTMFSAHLIEPQPLGELKYVAIAEQVVVGVARDGTLATIWLLHLPQEIAQAQKGRSQGADHLKDASTDSTTSE